MTEPPRADPWVIVAACVAGIVLGCVATFGVSLAVTYTGTWFANVYPLKSPGDFVGSVGTYIYYLCLALGATIGFIAIMRRSMRAEFRALLICAALPLLGFFALCSAFSIAGLTQSAFR